MQGGIRLPLSLTTHQDFTSACQKPSLKTLMIEQYIFGKELLAKQGRGRYSRYCSPAFKQRAYRTREKRNVTNFVLSLVPGIGLLDRAFKEQGFVVVRGPDLLWEDDIRDFHPVPGQFGGILGGPPCKAFSRLRYLVKYNGYQTAPNIIPEFERCVSEAQVEWFLMENV